MTEENDDDDDENTQNVMKTAMYRTLSFKVRLQSKVFNNRKKNQPEWYQEREFQFGNDRKLYTGIFFSLIWVVSFL